jgi:hypothetical protein
MTKINYAKLHTVNDDAAIEKAILAVCDRGTTVQMDIHRVLVAIATRWFTTGDIRPAVKHVNLLIEHMPKGIRSNAIKAWVETHMGLVYATEGENKGTFVIGKRKGADLDIPTLTNERWFEFKPEAEYKPIDFDAMWNALMKRMEKADESKGDKFDKGLVEHLRKARAEYMTQNIAF